MNSFLQLAKSAPAHVASPSALLGHSRTEAFNLQQTAIEALEQGVWTVISYFAESNKQDALKVARLMECSVLNIHEFDWERLIEVYGSKEKFLANYGKIESSRSVETASISVVNHYLSSKPWTNAKLSDADADKLFRFGIIAGASVALGQVHHIDPTEAKSISEVVEASIYTGNEQFNWDEIECH